LKEYEDRIINLEEVRVYQEQTAKKSDFERTELNTEKTGVELKGIKAVNPVSAQEIPIWLSDYVLMTYGTGAIMAVPAHDTRDYEFAAKFDLPIIKVIEGGDNSQEAYTDTEGGVLVNSGFLNGLSVPEAKKKITEYLVTEGIGEPKVHYKLRDWVFSRQRYWGEPIPVIWCEKCGCVPMKPSELPLLLPKLDSFMPSSTGESPLANLAEWVNVPCPKCGAPAKRETDTMPQWAGSSWYFLRYTDPHNDECLASQEALDYWLPVDWYNGGMEHTTLHLLYSRFWHMFLHDIGVVKVPEPYNKRTSHGMILGENNEKMSKSRGNVINPDDVVDDIGADAFRVYEMFMGAFDQPRPWSTEGAHGCRRFLERVWRLQGMIDGRGESDDLRPKLHAMIKKVSEDYERMKFNTAIAGMMSFVNDVYAKGSITVEELHTLLILLNPVAPHITEELWELTGGENHIYQQTWPKYDQTALTVDEVEIAIQIMGKVKSHIMIPLEATEEQVREMALADEKIAMSLDGKPVRRFIYIPRKLANIVI
jgi:leucyl-tRNA synthetase